MSSDSKSEDDYALNIDPDDECENLQDAYDRLYQLSEELTKNNYKLNKKMNLLVKEKVKTDSFIAETHDHKNVLTEKLAYCEKENKNLGCEYKILMGINSKLDREIDMHKEEKKVFEGKIAKLEIELISSNNAIKKMNTGSKALN